MGWLRQLFDFYLDSSIHVALAVASLVGVTYITLDIPLDRNVAYFAFFSTVVMYNFIKYGSAAKYYFIVRSSYVKLIQFFSFICFALMVLAMSKMRVEALVLTAILSLVSILYIIPFMFDRKNLRSLFGIKIYVVALCWSGVTVLIPFVNHTTALSFDVWMVFIQRFLFVFTIILPFEVRDLQFDNENLGTIPQRIGIRNTKLLGAVVMVVFLLLTYMRDEVSQGLVIQNLALVLITLGFLVQSEEEQSPYFCSFFVEGISILWLLIAYAI